MSDRVYLVEIDDADETYIYSACHNITIAIQEALKYMRQSGRFWRSSLDCPVGYIYEWESSSEFLRISEHKIIKENEVENNNQDRHFIYGPYFRGC